MLETLDITAIVSLPKFAFAPYTKEKTYAVFFTNRNSNQTQVQKSPVWMYIIDNDGLANSDKRFPTKLRNNRNGWIHDEISGWVTTDGEEMPGMLEERWLAFDDTKTNGTEWLDEKGIRRKARKGGMVHIETILNDKYLTLLPEYYLRSQQLTDTPEEYHSYQARDVSASDLFRIVGGNSGLTEEYLYSLLQYSGPQEYTLLTGGVDISEAIPIFQCQHPQNADRKITVVDGEGIHIVRKGKAGHINYLSEGRWTMTDDAYILVNKNTHAYELLLPWVVLTQQQLFKDYASNSDNGTWNKTGFLTYATFDIPSLEEQEAVVKRAMSG